MQRLTDMRWLFLFVLLANVLYITWEIRQPGDEPYVRKVASSLIPPLVLISELEPSEQDNLVSAKLKEVEKVEVTKPVQVATSVEKALVIAEPAKPIVKKQVKPIAKPVVKPVVKVVKSKTTKPKPELAACYTLGPFKKLSKLTEFTKAITNYVVDVSFRNLEESESSVFWVYLPPDGDKASALRVSKRLVKNKIKDYYIINSGLKRNGISLGHFKIKDSAYNHSKRLKKLGFKPEVMTIFETYVVYWLDYKQKLDQPIPDEIFDKYLTVSMNKLTRECI